MSKTRITASEAVFGFAAWLTCRPGTLRVGAKHNAGVMAELANIWLRRNKVRNPRARTYAANIVQPEWPRTTMAGEFGRRVRKTANTDGLQKQIFPVEEVTDKKSFTKFAKSITDNYSRRELAEAGIV